MTRCAGAQRLDDLGIRPHFFCGFAHRGKVHHQRYTGHVLQQHAGDNDGHFFIAFATGFPAGKVLEVGFGDFFAVEVA